MSVRCFLKNNKRIVGMVFVLSIALLLFSLLEREVRRQLPDGKMKGLLPVAKTDASYRPQHPEHPSGHNGREIQSRRAISMAMSRAKLCPAATTKTSFRRLNSTRKPR